MSWPRLRASVPGQGADLCRATARIDCYDGTARFPDTPAPVTDETSNQRGLLPALWRKLVQHVLTRESLRKQVRKGSLAFGIGVAMQCVIVHTTPWVVFTREIP